eukprot:COSAG03_NODE_4127_length_1674_cov_4.379683_2_plen_183_part_00
MSCGLALTHWAVAGAMSRMLLDRCRCSHDDRLPSLSLALSLSVDAAVTWLSDRAVARHLSAILRQRDRQRKTKARQTKSGQSRRGRIVLNAFIHISFWYTPRCFSLYVTTAQLSVSSVSSVSLCLCVSVSLCLRVSVSLCLCVSVSPCVSDALKLCLPLLQKRPAPLRSVCRAAGRHLIFGL